jgi:hypothetical protein
VNEDTRDFEDAEAEFAAAARLEAEDAGRDAALLQMRRRELADVASELIRRGDTVNVAAADRSFTGSVIHAAGDLMTLETSDALIDFNLEAGPVISVVERARAGGRSPRSGPESFAARLMELEGHRAGVEVGLVGHAQAVLSGHLRVTARDHIVFLDRAVREWFVPIASIGYVIRWRSERVPR